MKIVFVADSHIGANKFGASAAEWNAPLWEAAEYAVREKADLFVVAGDLFHFRNPTVEQYSEAMELADQLAAASVRLAVTPGNHDLKITGASATWPLHRALGSSSISTQPLPFTRWAFLLLPWQFLGQDETPEEAEARIMKRLRLQMEGWGETKFILTGHAMLRYGKGETTLGKEIMLPYEEMKALPGVALVAMGHVHDPNMPGYIGSTQPTDWSEAGQSKNFWVATINDQGIRTELVPYTTSLKLVDFVDPILTDESLIALPPLIERLELDAVRCTINLAEGQHVDPVKIRRQLEQHADRVLGVTVIPWKPERRSAGLATGPESLVGVPQAVSAWARAKQLNPGATTGILETIEKLKGAA